MRYRDRAICIAAFPAVHLFLCVLAASFWGADNWNWMWIVLLDLPLTYIRGLFNLPLFNALSLTILGTAWWLCVGVTLTFFIEWLVRTRRRDCKDDR
jgi:hypothetical protein